MGRPEQPKGALFSVGAARVVFDAPPGLPMAGYAARVGTAQGTHDALFVRALIVADGMSYICLLSLDILCIDADLTARIRGAITARLPIPAEAILVAATHTHAGPAGSAQFSTAPGSEQYLGAYNGELADQLVQTCVQAADRAFQVRQPARAVVGAGSAERIAANRVKPDGAVDLAIPWIVFWDESDRICTALYSLACHPTVLGPDNRLYSGDLTGALCRHLESRWDGAVVLGLTGAAGNVSTRFTRRTATFDEVDRLAALAAATFDPDQSIPLIKKHVGVSHRYLRLLVKPRSDVGYLQQRLLAAESALRMCTDSAQVAALRAEILSVELALASPPAATTHIMAEVQAVCVGEAVVLAFPGEMFAEFGLAARADVQPSPLLVAGYANGYIGYVPTAETTEGYEAIMSVVTPESGDRLLRAALELAHGNC